uniref:Uncharacterized protein n=1 Tax=Anguilla anguilla TaxID=7936 RepID=A0A0E9VKK8_ANGAN
MASDCGKEIHMKQNKK